MAWTNEKVLEFLELYKNEPIIWDPKNPYHRNRGKVKEAWIRIHSSITLNCSIPELKKKKESLMTAFRMHWNKKKRTFGNYSPTWFAYPCMESFLNLRYECDSTSQMENEFFDNAPNDHQQITSDYNIISKRNQSNNGISSNSRVSGTQVEECNNNRNNLSFNYAKSSSNENLHITKSVERDVDEYDLYGQLLAKKLRHLEEHHRDIAMHEIDNIMFKAKMQSSVRHCRMARSNSSSSSPASRKMKSPCFMTAESRGEKSKDISYKE